MNADELADRIEAEGLGHVDDPRYCALIIESLRSHAANEEARKLKDGAASAAVPPSKPSSRSARRIQPTSYHPFLWLAQGVIQPVPLPTSPAQAIVEPLASPKHEHVWDDRTWVRWEDGSYERRCQNRPCPDHAKETTDRLVAAP